MKCPVCGNDSLDGLPECQWCGANYDSKPDDLSQQKAKELLSSLPKLEKNRLRHTLLQSTPFPASLPSDAPVHSATAPVSSSPADSPAQPQPETDQAPKGDSSYQPMTAPPDLSEPIVVNTTPQEEKPNLLTRYFPNLFSYEYGKNWTHDFDNNTAIIALAFALMSIFIFPFIAYGTAVIGGVGIYSARKNFLGRTTIMLNLAAIAMSLISIAYRTIAR